MGILDDIQAKLPSFGDGSAGASAQGIGSDPASGATMGGPQRRAAAGRWDDEESSPISLSLRAAQVFLPFIALCIGIALAVFQKKWDVGPSFMTILDLLFSAGALLQAAILLAAALLSDKLGFLRGVGRLLRQVRIAVIINGLPVFFMLIIALATTISANVGGCKNPESDSNAETEGYTDAMGPFCRNKRAIAAFFWLTLLAWSASLALVVRTFLRIRKNPQSAGFVPPGTTAAGAAFPADDEEAFAPSDVEDSHHGGKEMGYRPSGDYYAGDRLFAEGVPAGYGRYAQGGGGEEDYRDPFEDRHAAASKAGGTGDSDDGYGGRSAAYEAADPYEAIRKSMDVERPRY